MNGFLKLTRRFQAEEPFELVPIRVAADQVECLQTTRFLAGQEAVTQVSLMNGRVFYVTEPMDEITAMMEALG